jgi:hypothetical protein
MTADDGVLSEAISVHLSENFCTYTPSDVLFSRLDTLLSFSLVPSQHLTHMASSLISLRNTLGSFSRNKCQIQPTYARVYLPTLIIENVIMMENTFITRCNSEETHSLKASMSIKQAINVEWH